MKLSIIALFIFCGLKSSAQIVEWNPDYKILLADFKSPGSEIGGNVYSLSSSIKIEFSYFMSSYEFMFTKNFNGKVTTTFNKEAALLIAPDLEIAKYLINFAQFEFDLTELYSRKLRKRIFDEKGAFSNFNFANAIYEEIQKELTLRHANIAKSTDIGRQKDTLEEEHKSILIEIESLSDYCKTCKPKKGK
jgi:hypothetical protein